MSWFFIYLSYRKSEGAQLFTTQLGLPFSFATAKFVGKMFFGAIIFVVR